MPLTNSRHKSEDERWEQVAELEYMPATNVLAVISGELNLGDKGTIPEGSSLTEEMYRMHCPDTYTYVEEDNGATSKITVYQKVEVGVCSECGSGKLTDKMTGEYCPLCEEVRENHAVDIVTNAGENI